MEFGFHIILGVILCLLNISKSHWIFLMANVVSCRYLKSNKIQIRNEEVINSTWKVFHFLLYFFCHLASFLHSDTIWLIVSSLSRHNLYFCRYIIIIIIIIYCYNCYRYCYSFIHFYCRSLESNDIRVLPPGIFSQLSNLQFL